MIWTEVDQELYELAIGVRQLLRSQLAQVDHMVNLMNQRRDEMLGLEPQESQPDIKPERPRTFGKPEEILHGE